MSEYSTPEERTEMPTARRIQQLRKNGGMHLSNEVVQCLSLITGFSVLSFMMEKLWGHLEAVLRRSLFIIRDANSFSYEWVEKQVLSVAQVLGVDLFIIAICTSIVASLAVMLQTDWTVREKKIKFDFPSISPLAGFKRIFSPAGYMNVAKALVKLALIAPIGFFGLKKLAPQMLSLVHFNVSGILAFTGHSITSLFWKVMTVLIVMAIFDYAWTKYQWLRNNKMTKTEVKDERKAMEGDEETKRKIQAKGLARIAQRLRESVPQADVIITNPTHFSVALKYDRGNMSAPIVVAKGQDHLALKIREIAKEFNIPILERKPLARALYASCEVGTEIPHDLFKAVAEVLAYVYRLKNPWGYQKQQSGGK